MSLFRRAEIMKYSQVPIFKECKRFGVEIDLHNKCETNLVSIYFLVNQSFGEILNKSCLFYIKE